MLVDASRFLEEPDLDISYEAAHFFCSEGLDIGRSVLESIRLPDTAPHHELFGQALLFGICQKLESLLRLLPVSAMNGEGDLPDTATAMSISRSIADAYLSFFYVCVEEVGEDERAARRWLQTLHAATATNRWSVAVGDGELFESSYMRFLQANLQETAYFKGLAPKRQKHLLSGRDASFKTQDELVGSLGEDTAEFRGFYELTSTYVHSLPASIFIMQRRLSGAADIRATESTHLVLSLVMSTQHLKYCLDKYLGLLSPLILPSSDEDATQLNVE